MKTERKQKLFFFSITQDLPSLYNKTKERSMISHGCFFLTILGSHSEIRRKVKPQLHCHDSSPDSPRLIPI